MGSEDPGLLKALKQQLKTNVERWAADGLVHRYADFTAAAAAEKVTVGVRLWFDPEDERAQTELRPAVQDLFLALGKQYKLRVAILSIDDPDGEKVHDYVHRGGILQMIFVQPRNPSLVATG